MQIRTHLPLRVIDFRAARSACTEEGGKVDALGVLGCGWEDQGGDAATIGAQVIVLSRICRPAQVEDEPRGHDGRQPVQRNEGRAENSRGGMRGRGEETYMAIQVFIGWMNCVIPDVSWMTRTRQ